MFLEKLSQCMKLYFFFWLNSENYLFVQCVIYNISAIYVPGKWRESLANWKTSQWSFYFSDLLAEIFFKENIGSLSHVNLTKSMVKNTTSYQRRLRR